MALFGDLGSGKTTLIRGIAEGAGCTDLRGISSPTFNILNIYPGSKVVYHFDLYRLPCASEFFASGFDEYFTAGGLCCIEWAEKILAELPANTVTVTLSHCDITTRHIKIAGLPQ
jgi:tRNA threonylcarbamoyladenosine biosynthesis protein TsaE